MHAVYYDPKHGGCLRTVSGTGPYTIHGAYGEDEAKPYGMWTAVVHVTNKGRTEWALNVDFAGKPLTTSPLPELYVAFFAFAGAGAAGFLEGPGWSDAGFAAAGFFSALAALGVLAAFAAFAASGAFCVTFFSTVTAGAALGMFLIVSCAVA